MFFSFDYNPDGGLNNNQLKSLCTVGCDQFGGTFDVRAMNIDNCVRMLKWLHPENTFDPGDGDLVKGKRVILDQLSSLPMYGSFDQMKDVFVKKVWDKLGAKELAKQAKEIIEQKPGSHVHGDKNRSRLIL